MPAAVLALVWCAILFTVGSCTVDYRRLGRELGNRAPTAAVILDNLSGTAAVELDRRAPTVAVEAGRRVPTAVMEAAERGLGVATAAHEFRQGFEESNACAHAAVLIVCACLVLGQLPHKQV